MNVTLSEHLHGTLPISRARGGGARHLVVSAGAEQNSGRRAVALPPPEGLRHGCEECDRRDKHGIARVQRVLVAPLQRDPQD
jgi:hypothetical protein